jgi:hypothetical protein
LVAGTNSGGCLAVHATVTRKLSVSLCVFRPIVRPAKFIVITFQQNAKKNHNK